MTLKWGLLPVKINQADKPKSNSRVDDRNLSAKQTLKCWAAELVRRKFPGKMKTKDNITQKEIGKDKNPW